MRLVVHARFGSLKNAGSRDDILESMTSSEAGRLRKHDLFRKTKWQTILHSFFPDRDRKQWAWERNWLGTMPWRGRHLPRPTRRLATSFPRSASKARRISCA